MSEHVSQPLNYVFRALDHMDRTLTAASPIAVAMIGITSVYYVGLRTGCSGNTVWQRERAGQVSKEGEWYSHYHCVTPTLTVTDHLSYISGDR